MHPECDDSSRCGCFLLCVLYSDHAIESYNSPLRFKPSESVFRMESPVPGSAMRGVDHVFRCSGESSTIGPLRSPLFPPPCSRPPTLPFVRDDRPAAEVKALGGEAGSKNWGENWGMRSCPKVQSRAIDSRTLRHHDVIGRLNMSVPHSLATRDLHSMESRSSSRVRGADSVGLVSTY